MKKFMQIIKKSLAERIKDVFNSVTPSKNSNLLDTILNQAFDKFAFDSEFQKIAGKKTRCYKGDEDYKRYLSYKDYFRKFSRF